MRSEKEIRQELELWEKHLFEYIGQEYAWLKGKIVGLRYALDEED
jgi:hypothetical protein